MTGGPQSTTLRIFRSLCVEAGALLLGGLERAGSKAGRRDGGMLRQAGGEGDQGTVQERLGIGLCVRASLGTPALCDLRPPAASRRRDAGRGESELCAGASPCGRSCVIGDGGVGKTALLQRHMNDNFDPEYLPTIFDDYQ